MSATPDAIPAALRALIAPSETFEIRIIKPLNGYGTHSGYFDNIETAAKVAGSWSGKCSAVYMTLNPVKPDLLARAANRIKKLDKQDHTTTDADITARRWFPLDFDPVRPSGISSTDAEHAAAIAKAREARDWLAAQGWPAPILADSGNGAHLLYRIDLPNDEASKVLVERAIKALAHKLDDRTGHPTPVCVDQSVFNAARIWKVYGTLAAKGDSTQYRPHRMAQTIEAPDEPSAVSLAQLQALAWLAPEEKKPEPLKPRANAPGGDFFSRVNDRAMSSLAAWVPALFPAATAYRDGYRVTSKALGRDLEEALSILPTGIKDFGLHDQGDAQGGKRTPVDLVIEHGGASDAKSAAFWLCGQFGIEPRALGWEEKSRTPEPSPSQQPATRQPTGDDARPASTPKTDGEQSAKSAAIPPLRPFSDGELSGARLHPRCIVEKYLYADLALVAAAGGTGKTTTLIHEAACIATGRDVWGCQVQEPGATLFITAEDSRELFAARLREVMAAMDLSDYERRLVLERVTVWDVSGDMVRLAELDQGGNIRLTELADNIVTAYRDCGLVQVVFDPAISFGPGERLVNDGEQAVVTACRRIVRGLNCCVRLIHHTGKANARNGAIDQYASRGGTALPDGCRMVTILSAVGETGHCAANAPDGFDLQPGESGFIMARAKLSYAPPQPNIWIRRRGFGFEYFIEQPRNSGEARALDADKVFGFLTDELHHGTRYTARALEDSGSLKLPRARLRAALAILETGGRLEERELPKDARRGKRKNYLHPTASYCAAASGAIEPENTRSDGGGYPNAPTIAIAPPYREYKNGAIDAALYPPDSLNAPPVDGAIAAQWRNSDGNPEPAAPPAGSGPTQTTSGEPVISQHTHKEGTPTPVRRVITVFK